MRPSICQDSEGPSVYYVSAFGLTPVPGRLGSLTGRFLMYRPGRVAHWVGHLTRKSGVLGSIPGLATYFRFFLRYFKKDNCQLLAKYVHEVLINRLGGLSLPRKSVVRLADRPDMTLDVYRGRKTTMQLSAGLLI